MNRLRQFCLTALMCTAMLAHADGIVRWLEMQHEFGTIHEEDGKVSCTMRLVNDGDSELIITQVRTSCGCTAAGYDKAPIAPGDTARITITYDPVARPGEFSKDVFVYTNGTPRRSGVSIHGVVIAQPETLSEFYPVAVGAMRKSGIRHLFVRATYRQRFAQRVVIAELVLLFIVLLLLTAVPEASLLSVTGVLFPSSFTDSLLPVFCIVVIAVSLSYGFVSGRLSTCEDALDAMSSGLSRWRGLVVLYLVLAEFFESLRYVFTAW